MCAVCAYRCRHAVAAVGSYIFIYGGLKGSTLLDDFLLAEDGGGSQMSICDPRSPTWSVATAASLCCTAVSSFDAPLVSLQIPNPVANTPFPEHQSDCCKDTARLMLCSELLSLAASEGVLWTSISNAARSNSSEHVQFSSFCDTAQKHSQKSC